MATITIQPGLLVSLHTKHEGGVKYTRTEPVEDKDTVTEVASVVRWETTRVIDDPEENAKAVKVAGKCGSLIRSVCARSEFGLLCRVDKESELDEAIADAKRRAADFNATAKTSRVSVFVLKGRIASTPTEALEAARAVGADLRSLIEEMEAGIVKMSVKEIRDAAVKAKKLTTMLDDNTAKMVNAAVDEARDVATELRKKLDKSVAEATVFAQGVNLKAISEAKSMFLDLDEPEPGTGSAPPVAAASEIDLGEDEPNPEREGQDRYIRDSESFDEKIESAAASSVDVDGVTLDMKM